MAERSSQAPKKRVPVTNSLNPLVIAFGTRLHEWRTERHLTLKEVAGALGVSISIVSEWERGHRFPSVDHLYAVSRYTDTPACCYLYYDNGECPFKPPTKKRSARRTANDRTAG